ncbi:MAG: hypothetical protein LUH63_08245, partial [Parabacteroides sp.]|nr:hypothetical protein [Parabacteroides sp.]
MNAGASLFSEDGFGQRTELLYGNGFSGNYFELSADIDLAGRDWTPIGTGSSKPFRGHFDGKGHVVKGLKVDINESGTIYAGLFGYVSDGTIQNLGVELSDEGIKAGSSNSTVYAGGIVGQITGSGGAATIRNCYVTGGGTVTITEYDRNAGEAYAGGIAGYVNKADGGDTQSVTLTHCYATVDTQSVTLTHCYATVDVEGDITYTGGIVGQLYGGTLSFTYATGTVTGGSDKNAAGICGYSYQGSLTNNLALNKKVSGGSSISGRVLGQNSSSKTLGSNYANPDMLVNDNLVTSETGDDKNAGASLYSENLKTTLVGTSDNETEWNKTWVWTDGLLPQLKMVTEDESGNLSYDSNWPSGSQPQLPLVNYLAHTPWADCAAQSIADGSDGTKGDPILISSGEELAYLAQQVNKNNGKLKVGGDGGTEITNTNGFSDKYFALSATIDLAGGGGGGPPNGWGRNPLPGHLPGKGNTVRGC